METKETKRVGNRKKGPFRSWDSGDGERERKVGPACEAEEQWGPGSGPESWASKRVENG